jgi:hypothetical protein
MDRVSERLSFGKTELTSWSVAPVMVASWGGKFDRLTDFSVTIRKIQVSDSAVLDFMSCGFRLAAWNNSGVENPSYRRSDEQDQQDLLGIRRIGRVVTSNGYSALYPVFQANIHNDHFDLYFDERAEGLYKREIDRGDVKYVAEWTLRW